MVEEVSWSGEGEVASAFKCGRAGRPTAVLSFLRMLIQGLSCTSVLA